MPSATVPRAGIDRLAVEGILCRGTRPPVGRPHVVETGDANAGALPEMGIEDACVDPGDRAEADAPVEEGRNGDFVGGIQET